MDSQVMLNERRQAKRNKSVLENSYKFMAQKANEYLFPCCLGGMEERTPRKPRRFLRIMELVFILVVGMVLWI